MSRLQTSLRAIDATSEWVGKIVAYAVPLAAGLLFYEVVARYVFDSPTKWAHETGQFFFGTLGLLAFVTAHRYRTHINLDAIYSRFSRRGRAIIDVVTFPLIALFCIIGFWMGVERAWFSWSVSQCGATPWAPPLYPIKTLVPIAFFLLILQGIANFIRDLIYAKSGREIG